MQRSVDVSREMSSGSEQMSVEDRAKYKEFITKAMKLDERDNRNDLKRCIKYFKKALQLKPTSSKLMKHISTLEVSE